MGDVFLFNYLNEQICFACGQKMNKKSAVKQWMSES